MARRRRLTIAGLAGAVAGWTAVNRAAVHRIQRAPDPVDPAELGLPGDATDRLVTVSDGATVRVVETGPKEGRPVVLLHGITLGAQVWPYQMRDLPERGLRVIAVDLRGHGRSPSGRARRLTLDRMAADVHEILDELELDGAVLVGHSMGGMVALRMLGSDPWAAQGHGRVGALGLVGTTANAIRGRGVPGLSELVAVSQPLIASGAGLACRLPGPTLPANDLAFLLARVTFGESSSPSQVRFTGEMTVVDGDHDLMTPLSQSEHMAAHIKGASIVVLPGCGHMVMLERPAELNQAIVDLAARI
jgi:pimeloyl-ACP methyl ester carboxylesterase